MTTGIPDPDDTPPTPSLPREESGEPRRLELAEHYAERIAVRHFRADAGPRG